MYSPVRMDSGAGGKHNQDKVSLKLHGDSHELAKK